MSSRENISSLQLGPSYIVDWDMSAGVDILGPPVYNVHEGKELALICKEEGGGRADNLVWRRKVETLIIHILH